MKLSHTVDALGVRLYTTNKDDFVFSDASVHKVCTTIECIGALPLPMKVCSFLIGAKAIPMITYGAHAESCAAEDSVCCGQIVVGGARPIARSKWLVQLIHGQPHRTNPKLAFAYTSILDMFRFCFDCPSAVSQMHKLWPFRQNLNHSLVKIFEDSCEILGLEVDSALSIRFANSAAVHLGRTSPRDIAVVLQQAAKQAAYELAATTKRKGFSKPQGLLDFHASTGFLRKPTLETNTFPPAKSHAESAIVGCTLPKDRLFAAGWSCTSLCRFCQETKETLAHLVHDCKPCHEILGEPVLDELGENFDLLGIVEHPRLFRLRHTLAADAHVAEFDAAVAPLRYGQMVQCSSNRTSG